MAFTYDLTTNRGKVRHRTGDVTNSATLSLTDAEVDEELSQATNDLDLAAWRCAVRLRARAARIVSGSPQAQQRGDLVRQLDELIQDLAAAIPGRATGGGVLQADKDTAEDNEALVELPIRVGMDDIQ